MPRPRKGPRLYLRPRADRSSTWVIRDRAHEVSTGCGEGELERAEQALERYIAGKYSPPQKVGNQLQDIVVADVMTKVRKTASNRAGIGAADHRTR